MLEHVCWKQAGIIPTPGNKVGVREITSVSAMPNRVVHLCYSGPSGASGVAVSLAHRLAARLPQTVLFFGVSAPLASYSDALRPAGVPWEYVGKRQGPWPAAYAHAAARLADMAGPAGIVVLHGLRLFPVLAALRWRRAHPPTLVVVHGPTEELRGWGAWRAIGSVLLADKLLCVTEELRDRIAGLPFGGRAAGRAAVAVNGVDTGFWQRIAARAAPSREHLRLCASGTLIPRKRLETALAAVAELRNHGWAAQLVICGDGPDQARLEETAEQLALGSAVTWRGQLAPAEVREVLAASHVLLHPSRSEGLSLAVLEALSCGCPVVTGEETASPLAGLGEAVQFAMGSGPDLARGVLALCEDPEAWQAASEAARRLAVERFSVDRQVEEFLRLVIEAR